jgi:CubicO group peptidase (beta-lactamase class C family)
MMLRRAIVIAAALSLTAGISSVNRPEEVGLSSERLQRINEVVQRYIDSGQITGAVTVVARKGKVAHFEAQGLMDVESKTPMRRDAIFRMASMSKPVTGVAILMLMEEGKLRLTDPVSRFIPEFKNPKVAMLKNPGGPGGRGAAPAGRGSAGEPPPPPEIYTIPAERELTIRDLMTHTNGLETGGAGSREGARISPRDTGSNLAAYVPTLGNVPLDFQPGTAWRYSALAGIETLGRIVEIVSGQTFDPFLKTRIFDPLGMKDTTFVPTDDRKSRLVTLYGRRSPGAALQREDTPAWLATRTLFSGGGGLWSTADDYIQFAQMLANGGVLNGKRLLGPRTIDLMASNHVGELYHGTGGSLHGFGFGLTVEVVLDNIEGNRRVSNGSFGWDGAFGTHFWVDRKEQLVGLLMVQESVEPLKRDFENAVMQAIIE